MNSSGGWAMKGSLMYSFSHNHGSGKWLYLKGKCYWRDPFFTSMIMEGRVLFREFLCSFPPGNSGLVEIC